MSIGGFSPSFTDEPSSSEANTVMASRHEGTLIHYQSESQTREESSDVSQQLVQESDNSGTHCHIVSSQISVR